MIQEYNGNAMIYDAVFIDFTTIGVAFASLVEHERDPKQFIHKALDILPRLYALTRQLPEYSYDPMEDYVETFVDELTYEHLRARMADLLGEEDNFLTAESREADYSDRVELKTISEYLADVYQNVGDLLGLVRNENEVAIPLGIGRLKSYFAEYWGRHLLLALTALHSLSAQRGEEDEYEA